MSLKMSSCNCLTSIVRPKITSGKKERLSKSKQWLLTTQFRDCQIEKALANNCGNRLFTQQLNKINYMLDSDSNVTDVTQNL